MTSTRLGRAIVAALDAYGIEHVVLCPGSRSTPVALALAKRRSRFQIVRRTDERVAGFTALGLAKAAGIAAVVVTSGTAVGNLMPAVMEAYCSGVALLVITADRPATLLGTGSNQTTDQRGIFGTHVRADLHLTSSDDDPVAWIAALGRAIDCARGTRTRLPGPVHINAAFTPPLIPDDDTWPAVSPMDLSETTYDDRLACPSEATVVLAADASLLAGRAAQALAENARVPLLAEPSSNARFGPCSIGGYTRILGTELGQAIRRVIVVGHPTLSRPVTALLSRDDVEVIAVSDSAQISDIGHRVSQVVSRVDLAPSDGSFLDAWKRADRELTSAPGRNLEPDRSCEPSRADVIEPAELAAQVWTGTDQLVVGPSQMIRDLDALPITKTHPEICWANRGLAGIDGVVSTASGIALGSGKPTRVLVGDLTFLHDLGSLVYLTGEKTPDLHIVVADDDGGAIFAGLEVGTSSDLDEFFTMPHGRDLEAIASGFGWPVTSVDTPQQLRREIAQAICGIRVTIAHLARR